MAQAENPTETEEGFDSIRQPLKGTPRVANVSSKASRRLRDLVGRSDLLVHLDYLDEKERAKYQPAPREELII